MHPIIFEFGPIKIYSYGLALFIATFVSLNLIMKEVQRKGFDKNIFFDLGIVILLSGILGARLLYVFLNLDFYIKNPIEIFMLHHGGLAIFGGVVLSIISVAIFLRFKKNPFFVTMDLVIPFVALAQSIGRIGCFFNGCCYGLPSEFGFYFPIHDATLIPTQLISSFLLLILYIILRIEQQRPHLTGMIFVNYILFYSILRFGVEFLRGDSPKLFLNLTIFQYFCIVLFLFGMALLIRIKWKQKSLK